MGYFHTPKESSKYHRKIELATGISFTNVSWKNDSCDSIYNDDWDIHIYLPNHRIMEIEEGYFSPFYLCANENKSRPYVSQTFGSIQSMVRKIEDLKKKMVIVNH